MLLISILIPVLALILPFVYTAVLEQIPEAVSIARTIPELKAILEEQVPFSLDWIPETALVREFIGGSVYYQESK